MGRRSSITILSVVGLFALGQTAMGRMKPSEGPPWFTTYEQARREGVRQGKAVFVYFTKHT